MTAIQTSMNHKQNTRSRLRLVKKDMLPLYFCLGVPLLIMLFVFVFPLVYSFALSLTNSHLMRADTEFVGLRNYIRILGDKRVWHSIRITLTFAAGALALQFFIGFVLALLIDYIGVVRGILRTLIVIPLMLTPGSRRRDLAGDAQLRLRDRQLLRTPAGTPTHRLDLRSQFGFACAYRHQRLGWRALYYACPVGRAGRAPARAL